MGRKVVFSAMVAAGLVQMAPANAQTRDIQQDGGEAPAREVRAPVFVNVPPPVFERAEERRPAPVIAEAKPREPDLADKDLASVPPEEPKPVIVDPSARRPVAVASRVEPDRAPEPQPRSEPRLVVAAAEPTPAPEPARVERVAAQQAAPAVEENEPRPVYAGEYRRARPRYLEDDRIEPPVAAPEPVRSARVAAAPVRPAVDDRDARPVYAEEQPAPRPVYRAPQQPAERPVYADESRYPARAPDPVADDRDTRPVYADDRAPEPVYGQQNDAAQPGERERYRQAVNDAIDRQAPSAYPAPDVAPRPSLGGRIGGSAPVYAEDRRDSRAAYPQDDADPQDGYPQDGREPLGGYGDRARSDDARWAVVDRNLRDEPVRDDWRVADRSRARACDDGRPARLQQWVRREADRGLIDGRAADDIEEEIGHAEDLQRSYCASGMNDWRADRLDRQYAQIEQRIRYEGDRSWQR